jgi:hypothetical protein
MNFPRRSVNTAVTVIGVDHLIQFPPNGNATTPPEAWYEPDLRKVVSVLGPVLICEEAGYSKPESIAHSVADSLGHSYCNVDMPREERRRRGISEDYANFPECMSNHSCENIRAWHAEREKFMFDEILRAYSIAAQEQPPRLVVICGARHLDPLARLLAQHFLSATITRLDWTGYK